MNKEILQEILNKVDGNVIVINHVIIIYDDYRLSDFSFWGNNNTFSIRYDSIESIGYTDTDGNFNIWSKNDR